MKKKYIKPESKVIVVTEKYSLLDGSDLTFDSGDEGGRHGNAKEHGGLWDTAFGDDDEGYQGWQNNLWD